MTFVQPYEHWYGVITGNPVSSESLPEYKYFKRDTLKPAIAEINTLTDINIELVEHKNGRRIEKLQFRVQQNQQSKLEFPAPPVIDMALVERVMAFGISQADASDLIAQHSDDTVRTAAARVEARMGNNGLTPLSAPAGYFRWTLQDLERNPQVAVISLPKAAAAKKGTGPSVMERFLAARSKDALEVYRQLDERMRKLIFETFRQQNTNKTVKLDKGIESALARSLFSAWYAKELWGEPSAQALAQYIEQFDQDSAGMALP
jgi:hypothetical protein